MVERLVYVGDFNNGKSEELLDRAQEKLKKNQGSSFYYLLPNGELLKRYRKLLIEKVGASFELNIFTFDDVVKEILNTIEDIDKGQNKNKDSEIKSIEKIEIDNPIKNIILKDIVLDLKKSNKLTYFEKLTDLDGFIESINDIIGEIKRSLISYETYAKRIPNNLKYKEISYIYKEYELLLEEYNLLDREGKYFEAIEKLRKYNHLENLDTLIVDQFYNFRPIELAILQELIKSNTNIYINIPFRTKKDNIALNKTLDKLEALGFDIVYLDEKSTKNSFEKLANKMFSDDRSKVNIGDKEFFQITSPTKDMEVERVFQEVRKLHLDGVALNQIGLVLTSKDYEDLVLHRSVLEGVPISRSYNEKVIEQPIIRELLNIIENKIKGGDKHSLINRTKSNYFKSFNFEERELYERILRENRFNNLFDFNQILASNRDLDISIDNLDLVIGMNKILLEELNQIPDRARVREYNEIFKNMLEEYNVSNNIFINYSEEYKELFIRDINTINILEDIFSKINLAFISERNISIEDYYYILEQFLKEEEICVYEGNSRGLHILNPVDSRGIEKEVLFILGLVQGEYPDLQQNGYFINDYELNNLLDIGMDAKSYNERLDIEILNIIAGISKVNTRLYLSYNQGSDGSNVESIFMEEIKNLLILEDINQINLTFDYNIKSNYDDITNKMDLIRYTINFIKENNFIDSTLYDFNLKVNGNILERLSIKNFGEYSRKNNLSNEFTGKIKDIKIKKYINNKKLRPYSISQLENYATCPYNYFLNYILNLEEMVREYELYSPLEIGNIYHLVLKDYYEYYASILLEHIKESKEFNLEESFKFLDRIILREIGKFNLDTEDVNDSLFIENIERKLKNYISLDIDRLYKWKKYPVELEAAFGENKDFFIEEKGKKIYLKGVIDRIDKSIYLDKYLLIDYKSSASNLAKVSDMIKGRSFQLPVYIMSQDKNIVAAAYGIIKDGSLEVELGDKEKTNIISKRRRGALTRERIEEILANTRQDIYEIVSSIEDGFFPLEPSECSEYCIYKDICRFEENREVDI